MNTSDQIINLEIHDDLGDDLGIPTLATPFKGEMLNISFQNTIDNTKNKVIDEEINAEPRETTMVTETVDFKTFDFSPNIAPETVSTPLAVPSNHDILEYIQVMIQQANVAEKAAKEALLYEKVVESLLPSLKKELRLWLNTILDEESRQLHKAVMQRFEADSDQLIGALNNIQEQVKILSQQEENHTK
ncbi:MAG: hypothetical protein K2P98_00090 [Neisseriaceae bacterium]|nr:hypothetical protein [Neisseriaceae bacterium]